MRPYALPLLLSLGAHGILLGLLGGISLEPPPPREERVLELRLAPPPPAPEPRAAAPEPRTATPPKPVPPAPKPLPPRTRPAAAPEAVPPAEPKGVPRRALAPVAPPRSEVAGGGGEASDLPARETPEPPVPAGEGPPAEAGPPRNEPVDLQRVEVRRRVVPEYPPDCRRRGQEGTVVLVAQVEGGSVRYLRVERSSGHPALDEAAAEALRRWRFAPGVTAFVRVPMIFRLQ